jgi:hypothetical protein
MGEIIKIYHTDVALPEEPNENEIESWGTSDILEQYWRRKELPAFFQLVEYDKDGNALLDSKQREYALQEVRRCKEGFWFKNRGKNIYITGKNYFYLTYWKLENDEYPEYRETDRKYFLFLNHWEKTSWALGTVRAKKRREGASSQATSNLIYECIFYKNSFCGLTSKTQIDAKNTFTNMVAFGYRQLPVFLKPKQLNNKDSVSELVFAHKTVETKGAKGSTIDNDTGHRSRVDYRAPSKNSYDSMRMSRLLLDEIGKFPPEVPASEFLSIVSKTLVQGAKRVGFVEAPSTANSLTNGGAEYKKIWDAADHSKGERTPNRFVRYFSPAYDGYFGFIDKYGQSVIEEPTKEQYEYLVKNFVGAGDLTEEDIKLGAKKYLENKRSQLTGTMLEEEIRMNPFDEREVFMSANTNCVFNIINISEREEYLIANPVYKRSVVFYRDMQQNVKWRDARQGEDFCWKITWFPPEKECNKFITDGKVRKPGRIQDGAIAVDSYSNSQGGRKYGSKASAWIGRRYDMNDPENSGKPIGHLYGRPAVKDMLHEQVMLAAEYYGYQIFFEHVADDYEGYFRERGKLHYLGKYPLGLIPLEKRATTTRHRGTPITPFSLTKQLDNGIAYFEYHCDLIDFEEILTTAKVFDPYNRTEYDCIVAFLILISVLMETTPISQRPKESIVKVYEGSTVNTTF